MTNSEFHTGDPLRTDAAKLLRFGGVATFGLSLLSDGIDSLKIATEVIMHHPVANTAIEMAQVTGIGAVGLLIGSIGTKALDTVLTREHS